MRLVPSSRFRLAYAVLAGIALIFGWWRLQRAFDAAAAPLYSSSAFGSAAPASAPAAQGAARVDAGEVDAYGNLVPADRLIYLGPWESLSQAEKDELRRRQVIEEAGIADRDPRIPIEKPPGATGIIRHGPGALGWSWGHGPPSRACLTGALYSDVDGTRSRTLFVCERNVWTPK